MERITSTSNAKIKYVSKLISSRKFRYEEGLFVLEGLRLCMDVVRSGLESSETYVTEEALEKHPELQGLLEASDRSFIISEDVAKKLSDTEKTQGVFSVLPLLDKQSDRNTIEKMDEFGTYIMLENVQDPANLGAVSRTAEALGITGLLVSGGCDVYSPKALRASMGALLRIPVIVVDNSTETLLRLKKSGIKTYASTPASDAKSITETDFSGGVVVVIGNEANGVTEDTLMLCNERITIRMAGRAESLNAGAAASIIMWEMVKPNDREN